jgi:hypothetical protein
MKNKIGASTNSTPMRTRIHEGSPQLSAEVCVHEFGWLCANGARK